jgi:hypothetical protein
LGTFPVAPYEGCVRHSVDFAFGHERTTKQVMRLYAIFFGSPVDVMVSETGELTQESQAIVHRIDEFRSSMAKSWDIGEVGIIPRSGAQYYPLVSVRFIVIVGRRDLGVNTYEQFERKISHIKSLERDRPRTQLYSEGPWSRPDHEDGEMPVDVMSYDSLLHEDGYRYRYEEAERSREFRLKFARRRELPSHAPMVFVSYKRESASHNEWVLRLAGDLRAYGIDVVLDEWDLNPGDAISDYIASGINSCEAMVFVISRASVDAVEGVRTVDGGGVRFELRLASARRMRDERFRIIGILRSGDRPPSQLADYMWLDFRTAARYTDELSRLVDCLHRLKTSAKEIGGPDR